MNIGIHFFDLVTWLFGPVEASRVHRREPERLAGVLELERARVRWFLSVNQDDLPEAHRARGKHAYRSLTMDGREIEFSAGFTDLHTRVYEEVLAGRGFGIGDAKPSIQVVYDIRHTEISAPRGDAHPHLTSP